jgi:hypothetical protein
MEKVMAGLPMLADFARLPYTYNQTSLGWASYLMIYTRGSFGLYLLVELPPGREEQVRFFRNWIPHPVFVIPHHAAQNPRVVTPNITVLSIDEAAPSVCAGHESIFAKSGTDRRCRIRYPA